MARPNKYVTHVAPRLSEIADWVRNGATDEEIAARLKIGKSAFYEYKREFSEFSDILKETKEFVDAEVENSLLKRALGYQYDEITRERNALGEIVVTKVVTKQVVPDTTAQIFWLKNRRPKQWRDKQSEEINENDTGGFKFKIEDFSDDDVSDT